MQRRKYYTEMAFSYSPYLVRLPKRVLSRSQEVKLIIFLFIYR